MQKSWKVVLLTTIGLILGLFPFQAFGNVVWESLQNNTPSMFKGYDKMFIVNLTHKDFITEKFIEYLIGPKAILVSINDPQQQFEAMRLSHLSLYITHCHRKEKPQHFITFCACYSKN